MAAAAAIYHSTPLLIRSSASTNSASVGCDASRSRTSVPVTARFQGKEPLLDQSTLYGVVLSHSVQRHPQSLEADSTIPLNPLDLALHLIEPAPQGTPPVRPRPPGLSGLLWLPEAALGSAPTLPRHPPLRRHIRDPEFRPVSSGPQGPLGCARRYSGRAAPGASAPAQQTGAAGPGPTVVNSPIDSPQAGPQVLARLREKSQETGQPSTVGADVRYAHDLDIRETQVRAKLDPRYRKREAPPPLPDGSLAGIFTNDQGAKLRGPYAAMAKATQSHRATALEAASQKRANDLPPTTAAS